MADTDESPVELEDLGGGVWRAPGARIIDRSGRKRLPIGRDGFADAMRVGTLVDKTALIADVLDSGYAVTLFCRPRRFGKTLNMTMMKSYFEAPEAGGLSREEAQTLFENTEVWDADGGMWREHQGAYPVVHMSFNTVKKLKWEDSLGQIRRLVGDEYRHHGYLREEPGTLAQGDAEYFDSIVMNEATDLEFAGSLATLCRMLHEYHGTGVVVLIDEYDAPVMAGYTNGYYDEVVDFLKGWLTGALKDGGEALAFACLTGVQRISKESIFSDLNNLYVSTPLTTRFDERYGFTDDEVAALATYLGYPDCMPEAREWYDGYRFGNADVYNPWSVIRYLDEGCQPGVYWANTSSNSVIGELVASADPDKLDDVYTLLRPDGGTVLEPLDLGVVFPDVGYREGALWSMLYLAGYVTTDDTADPTNEMSLRELRLPDREVARVFESEVLRRARSQAGGPRGLLSLHKALLRGDERDFGDELSRAAMRASYLDLVGELPCHMLLMGLLFGVDGYLNPVSNREEGYGRYDISLAPGPRASQDGGARPLVTVEVKYLHRDGEDWDDVLQEKLQGLAREGIVQIEEGGYDAELPYGAQGRLRWGVAFSGKHLAVACERVE